jgi:hypothetical protein
MSKTAVVVSLEYIKSLENTVRSIAYNLEGANCYNTNLGLSDDIDRAISNLRLVVEGLAKVSNNPSRYALQTSL